jgi:hypothetical protein
VKKRISYSMLAIVLMFTYLFSSVAFAATDYSGGLLDGKIVNRGYGPIQSQYLGTSSALTDNNENTAVTLEDGSSNTTNKDGLIFDFTTPVDIKGYRFKINSKVGVHIVFYKSDGTSIDVLENSLIINGSLKAVSYQNVVKIHIHQAWNTTTAKSVYEFNVYTSPQAPLNLNAVAEGKSINLEWDTTQYAQSYIVKRATTLGGPYTTIASNVVNTSINDFDVEYDITYYYTVTAVNASGASTSSNEASATPTEEVPEAPTNLIAIPNNENQVIQLNWDSVTGATYYSVKRSTVEGGPYVNIASGLTDTAYDDADVTPGIIYYYVVTAINEGVGSVNSNEASAVLEEIIVEEEGRAILEITMVNELVKEYDLSMIELNAFLDWYDNKDAGSGPAKYAFTKTWNKGPFKARIEYVIFDKILTFNVDEYDVVTP